MRQCRERIPFPHGAHRTLRRRALASRLLASVGSRDAPPEPAGKLPIAANPAVAAAHVGAVASRIVLVQRHIAQQPGAGVTSFEKVMAEDAVLGKSAAQSLLEGLNVIDSLADERPFAEDILVDIRGDTRVRVDARFPTIESGIARAVRPRHADRHARLQNAVTFADPALVWVVARAIERVRHGADKLPRCIAR